MPKLNWNLFLMLISNLSLIINCKVTVIEGGYRNVVVKFDESVTDFAIHDEMKIALNNFSNYLFQKTNRTLFLDQVIFLLPDNSSWIEKLEKMGNIVEDLNDETIANEESILVGNPNNKQSDNVPFVTHLGGCGEEGEYIFLPSNIQLLKDKAIGIILVHEWAHYRWGIFDEYVINADGEVGSPFYVTGNNKEDKKIGITGCPKNISGWLLTKNKTKCTLDANLVPDRNCKFYLSPGTDEVPRGKISIMMGFRNSRDDNFCGSDEHQELIKHDSSAENMHNKKCDGKSSWEVMLRHPDFKERKMRKCSNDLKDKRCKVKQYKYFIRRTQSKQIFILVDKDLIDKMEGEKIRQSLASLNAAGKLVNLTLQTFSNLSFQSDLVDRATFLKSNKTIPENSFVFFLSKKWELLCKCTVNLSELFSKMKFLLPKQKTNLEAKQFQEHKDKIIELPLEFTGSEIFDSFLENVLGTVIRKESMPFMVYKKYKKGKIVKERRFIINNSCKKAVFIATAIGGLSNVKLFTPGNSPCQVMKLNTGSVCEAFEQSSSSQIIFINNREENPKLFGKWSFEIVDKNSDQNEYTVKVLCSPPSDLQDALSVTSKVSFGSSDVFNASTFNGKINLAVLVTRSYRPVLQADVTAIACTSTGNKTEIPLYDDGIGEDSLKNDGIYSGSNDNFNENGLHLFSFKVVTTEKSIVVVQSNRNNEDYEASNPPFRTHSAGTRLPPTFEDVHSRDVEEFRSKYGEPRKIFQLSDFEAVAYDVTPDPISASYTKESIPQMEIHRGAFSVPVISYTALDNHSPGTVKDLRVVKLSYLDSTVTLEWTCSGDDGYHGRQANRTLLKYSESRDYYPSRFHEEGFEVTENDLRDGSLMPLRAKEKQRIVVTVPKGEGYFPENLVFFFSLVVIDEVGHKSDVSNLATAFFKPRKYSKELQDLNTRSMNSFMVLVIFLFFIAFIGTVIVLVKIYHKYRTKR